MKMYRKSYLAVALMVVLTIVLAACGGTTPAATPTTGTAAQPTTATGAQPTTATGEKFTIGISNPFISSEYRTQMIQELIDVNKEYMDAGITNELVIESADTDVPGQIQQLQNLMSRNVDAILVNRFYLRGLEQIDRRTGERPQPLPGQPLGGISWRDRSR